MNDLQHELGAVEKRTRRYWFDDGLVELAGGLLLLSVAAYLLAEHALRGTAPGAWLTSAFPFAIVVLALVGRWAVRAAKDRFVHPRTGYLTLRNRHEHRLPRAVAAGVVAMLFVLVVARQPALRSSIPVVEGGLFAVALLFLARKTGLLRFVLEGLACGVAAVAIWLMRPDLTVAATSLFAWAGLVVAAGGVVAFLGYLKRVPPQEEA